MSWMMNHLGLIPKHDRIFSRNLTCNNYQGIKVLVLKPGDEKKKKRNENA